MAGGSPNQSLLANRIGALLDRQMPAGCRTFNSDLRVKVASAGLYTYPDCSVVCGELELFGDQQDVVLNPLLIVEVLSPSTEGYDRGKKFELYRAPCPAFASIYFYTRTGVTWSITPGKTTAVGGSASMRERRAR